MGKFNFIKTDIDGVVIIEPTAYGDDRGYFMETYQYNDFKAAGIDVEFVQDNQSKSKKGVLRGLHFQKNFPQSKLVRVINGAVYDVAIDLRKDTESMSAFCLQPKTAASSLSPKILHTVFLSYPMKPNLFIR